MTYKLNQYQIDLINEKLPPQFAALKYRYPATIYNAANHMDKPKFPLGYIPKNIAIYYEESSNGPLISWQNGQQLRVNIEEIPVNPDLTLVLVDNTWTYIQVQGKVVLDRTFGIQFPLELTQHELMLKKLVHAMSSGNYKEFKG